MAAQISARLSNPAALTSGEIAQTLRASRDAAANRPFHVSPSPTGMPGPEMLLGSDGRPTFLRTTTGFGTSSGQLNVVTFSHYTRQAAMYCDGTPAPGELVADYENLGGGWTVSVRHSVDGFEVLTPIFAALRGDVALADAGLAVIAGRMARGLRAPWSPPQPVTVEEKFPDGSSTRTLLPGGPMPADAAQTLWIDQQSLLPLRWSITMTNPSTATRIDYGMFLVADDSIDLRPPVGIEPTTCIDPRPVRLPRGPR